MESLTLIQKIAIWALPVIFAITVHEFAHGWVAARCGDNTARQLGRLSLNPIRHIDPIGTLLVPGVLLVLGGFMFGWAKPVPVNWRNLRNPRYDMVLVAAAGPFSNLLMALLWGVLIKVGLLLGPQQAFLSEPFVLMGQAGVIINLVLMVLNLLPLPPLDGGRIMTGLLPQKPASWFAKLERFGLPILLIAMIAGWLAVIIGPPIFYLQDLLFSLFSIK